MPIARKDADRIRYARKKADVNVIDFNDWLKEEYGCKLSELEPEKVEDVIAGIATIKQEPEGLASDPGAETEVPSEALTLDPKEILTEENFAKHQEKMQERGADPDIDYVTPLLAKSPTEPSGAEPETPEPEKSSGNPYILFHFSNPWCVPRLAGVIYAFIKKGCRVRIRFDFSMREDDMSLQEALAIQYLKRSRRTTKHNPEDDGKVDMLFMDDPSTPGLDRYVAPVRIGVQPTLLRINSSLVTGIKRLTQYYTWGKREKADLKQIGVSGSLLTISGSPWLSYLAGLVAKGDEFDAGTAVLYPPLEHIGCKQYWKGSGVISVLTQMKCKIIIIRQNRREPNWLPEHFRMMDYLEPLNAAYEIPRYCIAPPGVPLPEPAALKVPTLRLRLGQSITRKLLQECAPESLPERYINEDASYSIVSKTLSIYHAKRKRQDNL